MKWPWTRTVSRTFANTTRIAAIERSLIKAGLYGDNEEEALPDVSDLELRVKSLEDAREALTDAALKAIQNNDAATFAWRRAVSDALAKVDEIQETWASLSVGSGSATQAGVQSGLRMVSGALRHMLKEGPK